MPTENPESKFRRDAIAVMANHAEAVTMRLDRTEQSVAKLVDTVQKQADSLTELSANVARMERAVTQLVTGIADQKEMMQEQTRQNGDFIRLCTLQAEMIREQRAS